MDRPRRVSRPRGQGYNALMCTMTWFREGDGYQVFFNRDERRTRKPSSPPALHRAGAVRYLAPLDGDHGGSWLGVNEFGLTLALLNGYAAGEDAAAGPSDEYTSRGLLLTALIETRSADELLPRLGGLELARYRSFLLVLFRPDGRTALARWIGGRLTVEDPLETRPPLVSSAFDTDEVRASRSELYRRMREETTEQALELHLRFHESHHPEKGPYSPCMHRPEARTVSFSRVHVRPEEIAFHFAPHSPCRGRPADPPLRLERSR